MAIRFVERPDSRSLSTKSGTLRYVLTGTTSHATAHAYALAATPLIFHGRYRSDVTVDPQGFSLWHVEVQYDTPETQQEEQPEIGSYEWSFETTGATEHITQAKRHLRDYVPEGKPKINHSGAIGVTSNGVEGTDIVTPVLKWTEIWTLPATRITWAYVDVLEALTGTVNSKKFRGRPAGTIRFDGATSGGGTNDPKFVKMTFAFARSRDVKLVIGDIKGIKKNGWECLWVEYEDVEDADVAKKMIPKPIAVHIEQIYDEADFGLLGIG